MEHKRLGKSGLKIFRLCLGCMTYGAPDQGTHPWSLPEEESRPFIRQALDLRITFFDPANAYSDGALSADVALASCLCLISPLGPHWPCRPVE